MPLDEATPGMASDGTSLRCRVKFYSNKILINKDFETNIVLRAIIFGASKWRKRTTGICEWIKRC